MFSTIHSFNLVTNLCLYTVGTTLYNNMLTCIHMYADDGSNIYLNICSINSLCDRMACKVD